MRRTSLALVGALTILLAACSSSSAPADMTSALSLSLTEFKFTPAPLQATAGSSLKLDIKNAGTVDHDFTIEKLGVSIKVKPGESVQQSIGPFAAGTYDVICAVPGHKEAGMVTKLTVK